MSDDPKADVSKRRLSWVWLIPIASLAIGGWLIWSTVGHRGPMIRVTFETAEGLQAGQSPLKYKDIQMGTLEGFDLTPERKVVMRVRTTPLAEPFLTEGTQFWVVKPRLFAGDITGLNTVLSGSFISMAPAPDGAPSKREFDGLEDPPANPPGSKGRLFKLVSSNVGTLSVGSPIFFRHVEVGRVVGSQLTGMAERVTFEMMIDEPYVSWVHDDSRFWDTSGISLKLDTSGVRLDIASAKAALLGGAAFETPPGSGVSESGAGREFELFRNAEFAEAAMAQKKVTLASYLTGTVGGLSVGAPVMLMGSRVGEVIKVDLQYDTVGNVPRVRAEYTVQIDKVQVVGGKPMPAFPDNWRQLIERDGLRAKLKGGSIITGEKQLSLEFDKSANPAKMTMEGNVLIMPAEGGGGGLDDLSSSATQLLERIGKIPFADIGRNLNATLQGASRVVGSPKLQSALDRLNGALGDAQSLLRNVNTGVEPLMRRLPSMSAELQSAIQDVHKLVDGLSSGAQGSSRTGRDLDHALTQLAAAADSVRSLADLLSRHPEALIRGRVSGASTP